MSFLRQIFVEPMHRIEPADPIDLIEPAEPVGTVGPVEFVDGSILCGVSRVDQYGPFSAVLTRR
ncbi:hypothetical protein ADL30_04150 [Streptomyces sp. NRRL S-1521]|nr:hypothetical protein ADL30_04150 [Streptomyces sp. NRRL S-1521]